MILNLDKYFMTGFLLSLALTGTARAGEKVLVFLGDSLTAGYGLAEEHAFPALIQEKLRGDDLNIRVVNAGISGDTTSGALSRLEWVMRVRPDFLFIALGANDGLRGVDLSLTADNLDRMITEAKSRGVRVFLSGNLLPLNYGERYREDFETLFRNLVAKHEVPFYPFLLEGVATRSDLNLGDGVHPNADGYRIIAAGVYEFLKPLLSAESG